MGVSQKEMVDNIVSGGAKSMNKNTMGRERQLLRSTTKSKQPRKLTNKEIDLRMKAIMQRKGMIK